MLDEIRTAFRSVLHRPAFAVVAVITLALGIGAATAIFSVVNAVLLRPLEYLNPERLVRISGLDLKAGDDQNLSPADFLDFQAQSSVFERTGAHGWVGFFTITGDGDPERIGGVNVTEGFFPTLGVTPLRGRLFLPEDDRPGGPSVVILAHGFWQRRFAADPAIVGKTIMLSARPTTVVGVLPPTFTHFERYPDRDADVFVPSQFDPLTASRGGHFIRAVARLASGVTVGQAEAQLVTIARRLEDQYPDDNTNRGVRINSLHESVVSSARPALVVLLIAVGLVLVIACANVANLMLANGIARSRELAIRSALGASRLRLLRQFLTESLVVSGLGAVGGAAVAYWSARSLIALAGESVPRVESVGFDTTLLAFVTFLAIATGATFGAAPAWALSREQVQGILNEGPRGYSARPIRRALRNAFIVAEVALSIVLLVGSGLFLRSFSALQHVPSGFEANRVLTLQMALPTAKYAEGEQIPIYRQLYDRIRALPGVREVGAINILPLTQNYDSRGFQIDDHRLPVAESRSEQARSVSPGYFRAMGVPLVRGREFHDRDSESAPLVVMVSDGFARRYWPGENPVGKRLTFNDGTPTDQRQAVGGPGSREVVGVVGDVKHLSLDETEVPMFYTPQAQQPSYHTMTLVVRSSGDAATLTASVRAELAALDKDVPLYQIKTLDDVLARTVTAPRFRAWLFGMFGAMSLALALVGIYGVVGYVVGQRTNEIGVRLALGAGALRVISMLVAEGLRPVLLGLVLGIVAAAIFSRTMASMLFGVTPSDPLTYAVVALVLGGAALIATLVPALRALRVDPAIALRAQ